MLSPFREFEVSLEQLGKGMLYPEFHTISCTPSCKFKQLSRNFKQFLLFQPLCYFSHFWTNFNILGIKMHVLQLRNSIVILSRTLPHSLMQFHAIFMQFHTILAISAIFGPISTCWVSKSMYSSQEIHWQYFWAEAISSGQNLD